MTYEHKVRELYDRMAGTYDRKWRVYVSNTLAFLKNRLALTGSEYVLDVASGTGELERLLVEDTPGQRVVGVDFSERMIDIARLKLRGHPSVEFRYGHVNTLPFEDGTFDLVVCGNSFHYFEDPEGAMGEMRRVVRPGGRVVIMDWCRDYYLCRAYDSALRLFDPSYRGCYSLDDMREFYAASGLRVVSEQKFRLRFFWGMMLVSGVPIL